LPAQRAVPEWPFHGDRQAHRHVADSARQHPHARAEQHGRPLPGQSSGVVAFLFGGGAGGTTCACNAMGDGVTNPGPVNGNAIASEAAPAGTPPSQVMRGSTPTLVTPFAADDDGGFFRWKAWQYYQGGAMTFS